MVLANPVGGACAWRGTDIAGSPRWRRRLDTAQCAALERALHAAERGGQRRDQASPGNLPLRELAPLVADIRDGRLTSHWSLTYDHAILWRNIAPGALRGGIAQTAM